LTCKLVADLSNPTCGRMVNCAFVAEVATRKAIAKSRFVLIQESLEIQFSSFYEKYRKKIYKWQNFFYRYFYLVDKRLLSLKP
jgi:hypothetical protein